MSKIGKQPVPLLSGVTSTIEGGVVSLKGPLGFVAVSFLPFTNVTLQDSTLFVTVSDASLKQARANWGTLRALLTNAVYGLVHGYKKKLLIEGIGFRATVEGKDLVLNVGFTHPIRFSIPQGIAITVEKSMITISGFEKQLVSQTAAEIRAFKTPEPYKGSGIRYHDEVIRRKAGKKVAGAGAATS